MQKFKVISSTVCNKCVASNKNICIKSHRIFSKLNSKLHSFALGKYELVVMIVGKKKSYRI